MKEDDLLAHRKAVEIAKARIMEEAAAKAAELEREWAQFEKLAAKFNVSLAAPSIAPTAAEASVASPNLTITDLIAAYRADKTSPYHKVQFKTRENYENHLRRMERELGPRKIAEFGDDLVAEIRAGWSSGGEHQPMADALTGMLRSLAAYGASALKSKECRALKAITQEMNQRSTKPRTERLTAIQARNIIAKAHEMGRPSIALAQALQFECGLRQSAVIGTWLPIDEKGPLSDITADGMRWIPGLRWSSFDQARMVLQYPKGEIDLAGKHLTLTELAKRTLIPPAPSDPLVFYERTGLPYQSYQFRRNWRMIADEAKVPRSVKNMDSRASSNDEEENVDIELELKGRN